MKNKSGMPKALEEGVEHLAGINTRGIRVHYNAAKPAQLNAHAYAQGADIQTASGKAHEAWHVVQQKQGRVQPTQQAKGKTVNDDKGLEKEADRMGRKALKK